MKSISDLSLHLGRRFVIGVPYAWLLLLVVLPFLVLLRISLGEMPSGTDLFGPPATPGAFGYFALRYQNFLALFVDGPSASAAEFWHRLGNTLYVEAFGTSLKYAALTTLLCLVIGYPFAYFVARSRASVRPILLMLVMLPFWTSFLLRVYAWKGLLADQGVVNNLLLWSGLVSEPLVMLYTDVSMLIGMTYVYLPFMILPLYATLVKMDTRLLEAAFDLGASPWKAFWLVTIPLSRPGIAAGSMLVFIPCLGEFVVPSLLGGADNIMIGRVVWDEMFSSNNWPRAAALSTTLILLVLVPLGLHFRRRDRLGAQPIDNMAPLVPGKRGR